MWLHHFLGLRVGVRVATYIPYATARVLPRLRLR
jgi:hypothetical protein